MNARDRRLQADYSQIVKNFYEHSYIRVIPIQNTPPDVYDIEYRIPGIRMDSGNITKTNEHKVRISLPINYPRQKPTCTIQTPIWHPNFRDGQICIGDIWGAGETLSDIIIHIGDMIQYRIWNTKSPLSADAAHWAANNASLFPIGNVELWKPDPSGNVLVENTKPSSNLDEELSIDIDDQSNKSVQEQIINTLKYNPSIQQIPEVKNDIEISLDELVNVTWSSTPVLQNISGISNTTQYKSYTQSNNPVEKKDNDSLNVKSILQKGALAGLIGGFVGSIIVEQIFYTDTGMLFSGVLAAIIAFFISAWEEIYAGARNKAVATGFKKLIIGFVLGLVGGFVAEFIYISFISNIDVSAEFSEWIFPVSIARAIVWAILGASTGLSLGIFPNIKVKIQNGLLGGAIGGFIGGFPFDYIAIAFNENDTISRFFGFTLIGLATGVGISLIEQISKQAWLKVVRGDFEGKEFILQTDSVRIGSTAQSNIVLFKDKLISPIHSEIRLENNRHVIYDFGTQNSTQINGIRQTNHVLREGDSIAIGNTVMIYHSKKKSQ